MQLHSVNFPSPASNFWSAQGKLPQSSLQSPGISSVLKNFEWFQNLGLASLTCEVSKKRKSLHMYWANLPFLCWENAECTLMGRQETAQSLAHFLPSSHITQRTIFQWTLPIFSFISSPKLYTRVVLFRTTSQHLRMLWHLYTNCLLWVIQ